MLTTKVEPHTAFYDDGEECPCRCSIDHDHAVLTTPIYRELTGTAGGYLVPVDPMEGLGCDSCE